jgi:hypothetical protein
MRAEPESVFVPADPPRMGVLALWGHGDGGEESLELVLPAGRRIRRTHVPARRLPVVEALPVLLAPPPTASASMRAWSAATLAGLGLLARGRLLPSRTEEGYAAWRVGPLDPADEALLRDLAAGMPPQAHAVPVPGSRPLRVRSPRALVLAWWDALADTLVRTAGAETACGAAPLSIAPAVPMPGPVGWLDEAYAAEQAGARLVLRIEPPELSDQPFTGRLLLRSSSDPSLLVDVGELWEAPAAVLARLGRQAETDLLLALRRGARSWPPLSPTLAAAAPTSVWLDDRALDDLLGDGVEALEAAGIEVLWPTDLFGDGLRLAASVHSTPAPPGAAPAGFSLDSLLEFRWHATLDGEPLTPEELSVLADAKRPLIRLRGRWLRADPALVERLRRRRTRSMTSMEALAATLTGRLEVDGELVEFTPNDDIAALVEGLAQAGTVAQPDQSPDLHATLRPYQLRGLAWMAALADRGFGAVLADDMGLGKTIQLIALHLHRRGLGLGPTLVVCPTTLLGTWQREIARFAPGVPVRRFHGGERHLDDVAPDGVVLTTYGVLRRDHEALGDVGWGLTVADEAQHAKNPLSRTARALRTLPSPARIALTGTPVENRLSELWAILDWTTPGLLGPLERFRHSFAVPVERYHDDDASARLRRLTAPFLLRRKKTDPGIAPELPRKTESDVVVPLTSEQATLYQAVVRDAMDKIESSEGIARRGLVLALLTALKQVCNHPAHYLKETGPLAGRSGKLAALDELLEVILDEGESVLVFSQYVEMCRLLQTHLADRGTQTRFLHGGVPPRRRERMVGDFQAGAAPVFLLSLKAGGVGLTLTRATHVVHFDRWWNPAVEDRATDRAYRIGQDRPVQVHRLVTEGTLEDRIAALMVTKRELADAVVGSGEAWLTELSDAELADLVSLGSRQ